MNTALIKTPFIALLVFLASASAWAAEVLTPGLLKLSIYTNIAGTTVDDLLADAQYPTSPTEIRYLRSFNTRDALPTDALEDYGGRIEGYLTPLQTGDYLFFLRSDKASRLFLSLDESEANAIQIAEEMDNGDPFMDPETGDPATSGPVSLTAGQRYFIMVLYKASSGGGNSTDFAQVAWRKADDATPALELKPIPAAYLSTLASDTAGPGITFTTQPANVTLEENSPATFTVAANVTPTQDALVQWQRNGVNIPGATGSSYTRFLDKADNAAKFRAVISVPGLSAYSAEAVATVSDDKTPPALLGAQGGPHRPEVTLTFSERLNAPSATRPANYSITSAIGASLGVLDATLSTDLTQVVLTTDPQTPGTEYTVRVNNVTDLAATSPLPIGATNQAKFFALGPWLQGEDGFVIWEAEDYDRNPDGLWFRDAERGAASGGVAMVNYNGAGGNESSTMLEYDILFVKTGTHILWYRNSGNDGNDDSAWLYLDGARPPERESGNLAAMSGFSTGLTGNYGWASSPYEGGGRMTFTIDTPGLHTIAITRREDGAYIDKLLITTDPNFNPTTGFTTFGPPATLRQGEPASPVVGDFTITTQPVDTAGPENTSITLTAAATIPSGFLYSYQWQKKQGMNFVDIPGAVATTLTLSPLTWDWNGAVVRLRVIVGGVTQYTREATLTVLPDTTPPTVTMPSTPRVSITPNQVVLVFSEVVTRSQAENPANYAITTDTGSISVQSATLDADGRTVALATDNQTAGKTYTVTVKNISDIASQPNLIAANTPVVFFYAGISDLFAQRADGYVILEAEHATRNTPASDSDEWLARNAAAGFSGTGYMVVPNGRGGGSVSDTLGTGALLEFDIRFAQTGIHTVWIRGWNENHTDSSTAGTDDSVYVGFDGALVGVGNDASLSGFPYTGWVWRSDRQTGSDPVTIDVSTAGLHVLNLWHREDGTLIDKIIIEPGNRNSGTSAPSPATANNNLGQGETWDFQVPPPASPTVSLNLTNNQTFPANSSLTVQATITAPSPITLVEFYEGTHKLGQTTTPPYAFTLPNVPEGVYSGTVQVTDALGYVVSATVSPLIVDSTPPVAQAVASSFDGTTIGVLFKETVSGLNPDTAMNTANYLINNGVVAVTSAILQPDNTTVLLTPAAPLTGSYTVKVENIADRGFGPNIMLPVTLTGNVVGSPLKARDIGTPNASDPEIFSDPIMPGFALALNATDFYIGAGGSDIWNTADGCHFLYLEKTGNFDVAARMESLTRPNEWAKASLMVREDLEGTSRNFMVLVTPPPTGQPAGMNLFNAQWRDVKGGATVSLATSLRPTPVPYPHAWLRLQRTNEVYNAYYGTNGVDWTLLHTYTTPGNPYPATAYVGIAVTSHNNGTNSVNTARAVVRDFKDFSSSVTPASPTLTLTKAGANVEISWTSTSSQFVLQSTANLSTADWQPVTVSPSADGNTYTVVLPVTNATQFFRLMAP
ncbi:MAG TPA: PA14 domain-containing protein [Candidatus Paceibacterota bacterium]|nr:PA14 domain-containing protein [Candidatus Paceibacterota bacterium]